MRSSFLRSRKREYRLCCVCDRPISAINGQYSPMLYSFVQWGNTPSSMCIWITGKVSIKKQPDTHESLGLLLTCLDESSSTGRPARFALCLVAHPELHHPPYGQAQTPTGVVLLCGKLSYTLVRHVIYAIHFIHVMLCQTSGVTW